MSFIHVTNLWVVVAGTLYCDHYYYYGTLCYCQVNGLPQPLNGTECEDSNECAVNNGGCEHVCQDTVGSYVCSCDPGYALSDNQFSCEGQIFSIDSII